MGEEEDCVVVWPFFFVFLTRRRVGNLVQQYKYNLGGS